MKIDRELLKKTKDDENKEINDRMQEHDHENVFKSPKTNTENYKKKYKSLKKKIVLLIITENLKGSASTITSSTLSLFNPRIGVVISSSTALLTSIAILMPNEYI